MPIFEDDKELLDEMEEAEQRCKKKDPEEGTFEIKEPLPDGTFELNEPLPDDGSFDIKEKPP